eukprot:3777223-Alexandrium_andersonii.AAC.1
MSTESATESVGREPEEGKLAHYAEHVHRSGTLRHLEMVRVRAVPFLVPSRRCPPGAYQNAHAYKQMPGGQRSPGISRWHMLIL